MTAIRCLTLFGKKKTVVDDLSPVMPFHLYFNKLSLPEDQKSKTGILTSLKDQAAIDTHL